MILVSGGKARCGRADEPVHPRLHDQAWPDRLGRGGDHGVEGDPVSAHEQAVGVDGIRSAGEDSEKVSRGVHREVLDIRREDDLDLVDLIGQRLTCDVDVDGRSLTDVDEMVQQRGIGHPRVAGEHGVCPHTAHGQGGAIQVTDALGDRLVAGAVVNGKVDPRSRESAAGPSLPSPDSRDR
jgi:hypothetical protein